MAIHKRNHGTVLITGASAGIGHELALEFGACAETLVLVARRLDRLERLREELLMLGRRALGFISHVLGGLGRLLMGEQNLLPPVEKFPKHHLPMLCNAIPGISRVRG